jgi:hypothetical protein
VLPEAPDQVCGLTTIMAAGALTPEDIDPCFHDNKSQAWSPAWFLFFGSPSRTRTYNLVVNSHPLCQLSYRGSLSTASACSAGSRARQSGANRTPIFAHPMIDVNAEKSREQKTRRNTAESSRS